MLKKNRLHKYTSTTSLKRFGMCVRVCVNLRIRLVRYVLKLRLGGISYTEQIR
jgi:hypothetical protein